MKNYSKYFRVITYAGIFIGVMIIFNANLRCKKDTMTLVSEKNIALLFPQTSQAIAKQAHDAIEHLDRDIKKIINVLPEERSFATIAQALDKASTNFGEKAAVLETLTYLSPDEKIRTTAQEEVVKMQQAAVDLLQNKQLYEVFKGYANTAAKQESLTPEQHYFIDETLSDFKKAGLELPEQQLSKVIALEKEIMKLTADFEKNINEASNTITVSKDELKGLDEEFINNLKRDKDLYILGVDYPTYMTVMKNAHNQEVRKKLYHEFNNRAYPANYELLNKIIELRDKKANLLGYPSYAQLSLDSTMAKHVETAEKFLQELLSKARIKSSLEMKELMNELPTGISLSPDGKLYPWDLMLVIEKYKKNKFGIDDQEIANYFPVDHTLSALFDIYQKFFDLQFIEEPIRGLWHSDVRLIKVMKHDILLGYILLDLYPRPGKYPHAAKLSVIQGQQTETEEKPALAVIMANFPPATDTLPPLFKRRDVETFFHEFGHALHALLGKTALGTQAGTQVKTDFVEMPSQMLEEWLWDPTILKRVSSHYKTGQPLPDELIDAIITQKRFMTGENIMMQGVYAQLSLECYKDGAQKDIQGIYKQLFTTLLPHISYYPDSHMPASFGHITGYGPKYYGYLWSQVFALDLFEAIKKQGLLNPEIGTRYAEIVLAPGGSKDPNELLKNFLGREPNQEAFLKDMGL